MSTKKLHPKAGVALTLEGLYNGAEALCSVFVSVYLWVNSHNFEVVFQHYLVLYAVTPCAFLLTGWYCSRYDRLHAYRAGLLLHAVYYATLLSLRERSPEYAPWLGALLGMTWGTFWAAANTFSFDVTTQGKREYYLGLVASINGMAQLMAPLLSGLVIRMAPEPGNGYLRIFFVAALLYLLCCGLSFWMPRDRVKRPYRLRRALFPGKDQRDWQWLMLVSLSLAGSFSIIPFLLALLMYIRTGSALTVGGFAAFQALTTVLVSFIVGRAIVPETRRSSMMWGVITLVVGGIIISTHVSLTTLVIFGFLRSVSGPLFGIPHNGLRLDTIAKYAHNPAERVEYLSAWEVPLAVGRIIMMTSMILLYRWWPNSDLGPRIMLFVLCAIRIASYWLVVQTEPLKQKQ